jgi:peptidoglycan/xylan/chitin deacetylase (PgdA/CDA1 family)
VAATAYVFSYDLEDPDLCLRAAPVLAELHRRHEIPATFFIVGTVIEERGDDLRDVFGDDPLFDLQSHTYSHRLLKDHARLGDGISLDELRIEIARGRELVEETFGRPCPGVRSGFGFFEGLRGEPDRLRTIRDSGASFLSSDLQGPGDTIPGRLEQPYRYADDGVPELLELPGHGWHDNVLKERRPGLTPEEEVEVQREWIDRALDLGLDYFAPVYHPHSIYRQSEDCRTIELLMRHVEEVGLRVTTYEQLWRRYDADLD